MSHDHATDAEEEYLQTIYWLLEAELSITGANIARAMQLSPPTVHEMVGRLEQDGYVSRNDDKSLAFTDEGLGQAEQIVSRHRLIERFLTDVALRPEFAAHIMGRINDYIFPALERLCVEAGDDFDIFYVADDFCTSTGPLVSPDFFRAHIKPYLKAMADICHAHGKHMLLHTCGSVRALLADIVDAGVDILEPVQTSAAGMGVRGLKRDFGDDITFYGSIDLVTVLAKGSPEDVRREVLKNFRVLGRGGGFILGPGHTYIQPDAPLENILMMYETAFRRCIY